MRCAVALSGCAVALFTLYIYIFEKISSFMRNPVMCLLIEGGAINQGVNC